LSGSGGRRWSRPIIPLSVSLAAGLVAGKMAPGYAAMALAVAGLAAIGCILRLRRRADAHAWPLLLFLSLGYQLVQPWCLPQRPPDHVSHLVDVPAVSLTGLVAGDPPPRLTDSQRQRFVLEVESCIEQPARACSGRVLVTLGPGAAPAAPGDRLRVAGRLRRLRNFGNPDGFDYRGQMAWSRIDVSLFAEAHELLRLGQDPGGRAAGAMARLRQRLNDRIAASCPGQSGAVLQALATGQRSGISKPVQQTFARVGIAHLLSISGLHVGIVAAAVMGLMQVLLSRLPGVLWRGAGRKAAAAAAVLPVAAYAWLAGMSPPTLRAMLMVLTVLAALLVEREFDAPSALATAALVIVTLDPPALFSISFQLSFTAVAALLAGGRLATPEPAQQRPAPWGRRAGRWAAELVWVSLLATVATMPLTLRAFHQVSLIAPLANLFFVPVLGSGVVILLLASLGLWLCGVEAALWGLGACGLVTEQCLRLAQWLADWPWAALETIIPTRLEVALGYALLIALLGLRRTARRSPGNWRRCRWAMLALAALTLLGVDAVAWLRWRFWHRDLRVTVIDVGQGSSVLLELPGGDTMLVDGGGFGDGASLDTGEHIVGPLLRQRKILTLDTMVLTHPDTDHVGGLPYLASHFTVGRVITNGDERDSPAGQRLMAIAERRAIACPAYQELPRRWQTAGVEFELLWPPRPDVDRPGAGGDRNDRSIVLAVRHGDDRLLLPGDIRADVEAAMVAGAEGSLRAGVLLAPHHGSRSANSAAFIAATRPGDVVFSVGGGNRYRFPHPEVLERYRRAGARLWRTDVHGALSLRTVGRGFEVRPTLAAEVPPEDAGRPDSP
jgi:competence protein ComEC